MKGLNRKRDRIPRGRRKKTFPQRKKRKDATPVRLRNRDFLYIKETYGKMSRQERKLFHRKEKWALIGNPAATRVRSERKKLKRWAGCAEGAQCQAPEKKSLRCLQESPSGKGDEDCQGGGMGIISRKTFFI